MCFWGLRHSSGVRFLAWLRAWHSPLRLRSSLARLRHDHKYPFLALLRLFVPYPSYLDKKYGTGITRSHFGDIHNLRAIPIWRLRDTALRSIYHPADSDPLRYSILASIVEELHETVNWRLSLGLRRNHAHVYHEKNSDPLPTFIPEELPPWTRNIGPLHKGLLSVSVPPEVLDAEGNLVLEAGGKSLNFARRNILTNTGWFYTI
ncbi:hypothetical protein BJX65DRAFT_300483 [Aspergillus insuetus]